MRKLQKACVINAEINQIDTDGVKVKTTNFFSVVDEVPFMTTGDYITITDEDDNCGWPAKVKDIYRIITPTLSIINYVVHLNIYNEGGYRTLVDLFRDRLMWKPQKKAFSQRDTVREVKKRLQ